MRLRRRTLFRGTALAAAALAVGQPGRLMAQEELPWTAIGFSQGGLPLVVHHLGDSPTRAFIMGGQHGGPEENTTRLVQQLMAHYADAPDEIPGGLGLDFMPMANPDGTAVNSRQYLSGVDPNRNWGGSDWASDGYDSNARFVPGLGGPAPFSEQETRFLADWLLAAPPALVLNYHSAGGFLFAPNDGLGGEVGAAFADASGYPRPTASGGPSPLPYRATGSMNPWLRQVGILSLFVELTTPTGIEYERNLAGVQAALTRLAQG
jgi:hypothetical protein